MRGAMTDARGIGTRDGTVIPGRRGRIRTTCRLIGIFLAGKAVLVPG